ncbi:hypothetical protein [Terriglobus roseus]|uniref:Winged helix-turn-helix domain-containing protein n=1 Tax=Terriglobus roseus TaxID=392734 RepID=A0A1G7GQ57_9BACT|nr:hypothetical protein [Terriglobus roseus]SDE90298.1 hypothetical protein SAMN05444167_0766 [Terriglobus roseus]
MDAVQNPTIETAKAEFTVDDPRWLLVRRIARSNTFARADRLSKLLLYVCRMHLSGRDSEVNEQRIGIDVFRRSPSFDSGADTIVRTHATRLRQKLELYFSTEGADEAVRLEIPRGGYVPRFVEHVPPTVPANILSQPSEESVSQPVLPLHLPPNAAPESRNPFVWAMGGLLAGLLAALMIAVVLVRSGHTSALFGSQKTSVQTTAERRFWNGLLQGSERSYVVVGDSGLVLYQTFARREITLSDYIAGRYRRPEEKNEVAAANVWENDLPARRYTSVADLNLAVRFTHLPQWEDQRTEVVFARDLRPVDAAKSNLILIGSRVANPWVSLVDSSMNFTLEPSGDGRFAFRNRHPLKGEQLTYAPSDTNSGTTDSSVYALVYYRPESDGVKKILLLSGLWQSGTEAAGKYVLTDPQFAAYLSKIERPDGTFPQFELLVRVHSVAGNAFASSIIASRVN